MNHVEIHTDGACKGNPGPGGWGVLMRSGEHVREIFGGELETTNNRMELTAVIEAFMALKRPCKITLYLDSEYVRKGITEWIHGWKAKGWRTAAKQPVKNADLWQKLDQLVASSGHLVEWRWVKGHAGNPENERCDLLANNAINSGKLLEWLERQEYRACREYKEWRVILVQLVQLEWLERQECREYKE